MARTNNIPQFDASDTNIGEAPSNGFSPNTTISSAQVNGALRYSSFAVSALLSAIGSMTNNTGSYEYTGDGVVGSNTLKNYLVNDLTDIINRYTFNVAGTFTKTIDHNDNIRFVKASVDTPDIGIVYVGRKSQNHRYNVNVVSNVGFATDYYALKIGCTDYNAPALGTETVNQVYGNLYLKKAKTSTDASVTFADGTYSLYPVYKHHITIRITPTGSTNIKDIQMYLVATILGYNGKLTSLNQLRNFLDKSNYNASGYVNINNQRWCPIYLLANGSGYSNMVIFYLDGGSTQFTLESKHTYTITDEVF